MPNIHHHSALKPFLAKLKEEGTEYDDRDTDPQCPYIQVLYRNEKGYQKCRTFHKPPQDEEIRNILAKGDFPPVAIELMFSEEHSPISTPPLKFVEKCLEQYPLNMVLSGTEQIGKTYAAVWMVKQLASDRRILVSEFVRATNLRKIKKKRGWGWAFNPKADVLVLDDLGTETVVAELHSENQDKRALLFELIDYRISIGAPFFITTNLTLEQLNTRYGYKTVSRLENNGVIKEFKDEEDKFS